MDARHGPAEGPLTAEDLAARDDFSLGTATISPSTRKISGPGGSADVEPRVMQVLVVLADAAGRVVARNTLFQRCWGDVYVGDDSLNRTVGAIRKLAGEVAGGSFAVETVPRTGYRLTVAEGAIAGAASARSDPATSKTRRQFIGGGVAAAALLGAGGLWLARRSKPDPRFDALMTRGEDALRVDQSAAPYFQQAVSIDPHSARAWGLLAYSTANAVSRSAPLTGQVAHDAHVAASKALEIDPKEPNALVALTLVESGIADWVSTEEEYRRILSIAPDNTNAMRYLGLLLQGVGRCRDALAVVERAVTIEPLAPDHWVRKAGRLWVLGRIADADRIIDRAMQFWPSHPLVRLMRLMIYAFTGRPGAALSIVDSEAAKPIFIPPPTARVWRTSFQALQNPTSASVAAARAANLEGSQGSPQIAAMAIPLLATLGDLDGAFEVANGFLLDRGSIIVRPRLDPKPSSVNGTGWRNTYGLFIPPTKPMRLDPRFNPLADGLGLTDYWRKRGIGPDASLFQR